MQESTIRMRESSLRRLSAGAGIAFVVLVVASIALTVAAPMPDKSAAKIVKWYADHRALVFSANAVGGLGAIAFLWFIGYLHHMTSLRGGASRALSSIMFAGGISTVIMATVSGLPAAALAVGAGRSSAVLSDGVVHELADLDGFGKVLIGLGLTVLLAALGMMIGGGAVGPRWASPVAYLGSALNVIGSVAGFYVSRSGKPDPAGFLGLIGTVLFFIIVLAISIDLLSRSSAAD